MRDTTIGRCAQPPPLTGRRWGGWRTPSPDVGHSRLTSGKSGFPARPTPGARRVSRESAPSPEPTPRWRSRRLPFGISTGNNRGHHDISYAARRRSPSHPEVAMLSHPAASPCVEGLAASPGLARNLGQPGRRGDRPDPSGRVNPPGTGRGPGSSPGGPPRVGPAGCHGRRARSAALRPVRVAPPAGESGRSRPGEDPDSCRMSRPEQRRPKARHRLDRRRRRGRTRAGRRRWRRRAAIAFGVIVIGSLAAVVWSELYPADLARAEAAYRRNHLRAALRVAEGRLARRPSSRHAALLAAQLPQPVGPAGRGRGVLPKGDAP